ncbi:geranylgeranylglycerol-phosphate geranylgeranyltransferase [Flavobacterium sp.]|jgi:4-hydroxybenzoate polyprenyltransferase|uniref:geranylgeranylglycerol-phosphate geranylgeranyltransferase n=1 Tax=Flavobacterium sp. TaxID=239 RepID=UPI0037BE22A0
MKHFFKLIRIENLVLFAFIQLIIKYGFLNHIHFKDALGAPQSLVLWQSLSNFQYVLLVFATLFILAGGYIINAVFDVDTDNINKPNEMVIGTHISEKTAYNLYFAFTCLGVGIGFYLSRVINKPAFATIFVICAALLYIYSNGLKQIPILGNTIVALVAALSIVIISFFNILPAIYGGNEFFMKTLVSILTDYAIFIFLLQFAIEIIKTITNEKGDATFGISTVATSFGIKNAKIIGTASLVLFISYLTYYLVENLAHNLYAVGYFILFIIAPLLFVAIKLFQYEINKEYLLVIRILRMVQITTMLSLLIILISMQYA